MTSDRRARGGTHRLTDGRGRTKALLLAAGRGERLRPLTATTPKPLIPLAGRPLLDFWAQALELAGVVDVLINTHHLRARMRAHLDTLNAAGPLRWHEAYEPTLLGSAGTLSENRHWVDDADDCLVIYADNFSTIDLRQFLGFHRASGLGLTLMLFHAPDPRSCGIVELAPDGRVLTFEEKPERPASDLAFGGVLAASAEGFRRLAALRAFDLARDALPRFTGRMAGWIFEGYHRDIGSPESLAQVRRHLAENPLRPPG